MISSQAHGAELYVGFHWGNTGWYVVFYHFDGRWMIYEEGISG